MLFAGVIFWPQWTKGVETNTFRIILGLKLKQFPTVPASLEGPVAGDAGRRLLSSPDYAAFTATLVITGLKKLWRIGRLPCSVRV